MEGNYFRKLYDIDMSKKIKNKGGVKYLSWASAWADLKKEFPEATYMVYEQPIEVVETLENKSFKYTLNRPWFDDGRSCWVKVGVTVEGIEHIETYAVMDFKYKALESEKVTSVDVNKAIKRALAKACSEHGLALYIYEGEDLPEELKEVNKLQAELMDVIMKKSALSPEAKDKVAKLCKESDAEANGDPRLIEDLETLKDLKKKLMAIRK